MDLNSSELSASFLEEICTKGATSTPDAAKISTEMLKRKLSTGTDQLPAKRRLLNNTLVESNVSIITINDTMESEKTLVAPDDGKQEVDESVIFVSETFAPLGSSKRMIIIDGSNVAFAHSKHKEFSVEGIKICIDYFCNKGFDVKAVVPQVRLKRSQSTNQSLLEGLRDEGKVVISPCKSLPNGKSLISYDDRFLLDLALEFDGVVISNDNFHDLFDERDDYKRIIETRIIGFMFCNDVIMIPMDPYGRHGPMSREILFKDVDL